MSIITSYPDVPNVPGVPQVLRNPQAVAGSLVNSVQNIAIGAAQGLIGSVAAPIGDGFAAINGAISNVQNIVNNGVSTLVNGAFGLAPVPLNGDFSAIAGASPAAQSVWGIFNQDGTLAINADSIKSFDFKHEWRLPNYPMEQGAFQNYDKVQLPYEPRVTVVKSGTPDILGEFLNSIESAANSINLYNIFTPGAQYTNVSISSYNYKRSATNGVTMLTVEITFEEIRLAQEAAFSSTASPSGADAVNGGIVQAVPITTSANLTNGLPTNNAQFLTGIAATQNISTAASSVSGSTVSAIVSTETPAVSANQIQGAPAANASFPVFGSGGPYVNGSGDVLTYSQAIVPSVATYSDAGDGILVQTTHDANGAPKFTKIPKPAAIQ